GAPNRSYKDRHHKPELICALTPFMALSGFRALEKTRALVRELACEELSRVCVPLASSTPAEPATEVVALRTVFASLMAMVREVATPEARAEGERLVAAVAERCRAHESAGGEFHAECAWMLRLATLYPGDVGAVVSLLLNLVRLEPGQSVYLPAGNL